MEKHTVRGIVIFVLLSQLLSCSPTTSSEIPSNTDLATSRVETIPPESTTTSISSADGGRCGDGICDQAEEQDPSLCPQDCTEPGSRMEGSPTPAPSAGAPPGQTVTEPNIVFILTDDLDFAAYEHMPKLKSLLTDQGTTLSNFLISMPLCCPSRATILRGQYGHNTQIMGNDLPFGGFQKFYQLGEEESTIATWLQLAGYRTMLAGKYLNAFPNSDNLMHIPPGWTEWYSPMEGVPYTEFNYTLNENGQQVVYGDKPEDYGTDVYGQKTIEFIQRSAEEGKPFFAHVSVYAPHYPTTPAPRHVNLFNDARAPRTPNFNEEDVSDKPSYIRELPLLTENDLTRIDEEYRNRLRAMQAVDDMIESIVSTLQSTGQLKNTYIFFTSDNGYHFGNHRQMLGKTAPYEEEIRVLLIVRGPSVPAGVTLDHLTGNIDLAPTWADLAGIDIPDFVDGRSLVPLLRSNPPPKTEWRQCYLLEHAPFDSPGRPLTSLVSVKHTPSGLLEPPDPVREGSGNIPIQQVEGMEALPYRAIRTEHYLFVEYPTNEKELYDLRVDPYQLENLVSITDIDLLEELTSRLHELYACSGETCRDIEDKPFIN